MIPARAAHFRRWSRYPCTTPISLFVRDGNQNELSSSLLRKARWIDDTVALRREVGRQTLRAQADDECPTRMRYLLVMMALPFSDKSWRRSFDRRGYRTPSP